MWAMLPVVIKLVVLIISTIFEKSAEKKKKQQEAIKQVQQGIKDRDPSLITAGFDSINNA